MTRRELGLVRAARALDSEYRRNQDRCRGSHPRQSDSGFCCCPLLGSLDAEPDAVCKLFTKRLPGKIHVARDVWWRKRGTGAGAAFQVRSSFSQVLRGACGHKMHLTFVLP